MKKYMLIAAITLLIAAPAAAQTAPAQPAQDHSQHNMQGHAAPAQQGQPQGGQHDQHQGHAMGDCCADRNNNGRMDCCENMPQGRSCCEEHQPAPPAQPQGQPNR
jgi:hypothetical protein